jgi:16S rRNA G966 N2-methylase RsmD
VQGRSDALLGGYKALHAMNPEQYKTLTATSIFDPALCELAYDWFSAPGHVVLDPFAGGSVRGVVASRLAREYTGVDLSTSQIEANRAQAHLGDPDHPIRWINGDSNEVLADLLAEHGGPFADMVFSCPPYFDLESYSDGPADLSAMTYDEFLSLYRLIIKRAVQCLKPDRFAGWVISDVRDTKGYYRGLVSDSIQAFQDAGAPLYNDLILTDPVGSVAVRAARPFDSSRKVARLHQHLLIFVKGDPKRASADLNCAIEEAEAPLAAGEATLW